MRPDEIRKRTNAAPIHETVSKRDGDHVLYWCNECEMIVGEFDLKTGEYRPKKGLIDAFHRGTWSETEEVEVEIQEPEVKTKNRTK